MGRKPNPNPLVACACGCGEKFRRYYTVTEPNGKIRRQSRKFLPGHVRRTTGAKRREPVKKQPKRKPPERQYTKEELTPLADTLTFRPAGTEDWCFQPPADCPTPQQIQQRCKEVQATWDTATERVRRTGEHGFYRPITPPVLHCDGGWGLDGGGDAPPPEAGGSGLPEWMLQDERAELDREMDGISDDVLAAIYYSRLQALDLALQHRVTQGVVCLIRCGDRARDRLAG